MLKDGLVSHLTNNIYKKGVVMATDTNLEFIKQKIYKIRSAIMYTMSNELVKLPNNVVTAVKVDDEGHLWFLSKKPAQFVSECEQVFPARLKFYKKGIPYAVEVSGRAVIVNSDVKSSGEADSAFDEKEILIKMTMVNVEYADHSERRKNSLETLMEIGYKWFLRTIAFPRHAKPVLSKLHHPVH